MVFSYAMGLANRSKFMSRRRRRFAKKYPRLNSLGNVAGKVLGVQKQVNFLKGVINAEKQYFDTDSSTTLDNTGQVISLALIPAGDDIGQRTGNSILAKYIQLRAMINMDTSATQTINFIRCILIVDKQNTGTAPTVNDILEDVDVDSPIDRDRSTRYWILYDKTFALNLAGRPNAYLRVYRKLNFHLKFTGTSNTDVYTNQIYMVLLSTNANGATNPVFNYHARLAYYDN